MNGEKNLFKLLKTMKPELNSGEYVFCTLSSISPIDMTDIIMFFREQEGPTVILKRETADKLNISYSYIASWITLTVHSSLEAIGLTAAFSKALAEENISCNVVAGYYHDHIFIDRKDTERAMVTLNKLSQT